MRSSSPTPSRSASLAGSNASRPPGASSTMPPASAMERVMNSRGHVASDHLMVHTRAGKDVGKELERGAEPREHHGRLGRAVERAPQRGSLAGNDRPGRLVQQQPCSARGAYRRVLASRTRAVAGTARSRRLAMTALRSLGHADATASAWARLARSRTRCPVAPRASFAGVSVCPRPFRFAKISGCASIVATSPPRRHQRLTARASSRKEGNRHTRPLTH